MCGFALPDAIGFYRTTCAPEVAGRDTPVAPHRTRVRLLRRSAHVVRGKRAENCQKTRDTKKRPRLSEKEVGLHEANLAALRGMFKSITD